MLLRTRLHLTRKERVDTSKAFVFDHYDAKQQEFLSFVLDHYVDQGVEELDQSKMASLLELKYDTINDAVEELEGIPQIRDLFIGFREYLYAPMVA
nr:type I restriction-modification enzyme R subunit C-terminal domain-containing protein [uncultured Desulfobacter sp.]